MHCLMRVALAPAQLVCSGVQLLLGRASAPPGGSFTKQGSSSSVERQNISNSLIGYYLENKRSGNANHKIARLTDWCRDWFCLDEVDNMASWDSTRISIYKFYTNTAMAPTSNSPLLLRNLHHFWSYSIHSHTRCLLLRGLCYCLTLHRDTCGCAFVFWGSLVQKLLGACKYASLMRMLDASDCDSLSYFVCCFGRFVV